MFLKCALVLCLVWVVIHETSADPGTNADLPLSANSAAGPQLLINRFKPVPYTQNENYTTTTIPAFLNTLTIPINIETTASTKPTPSTIRIPIKPQTLYATIQSTGVVNSVAVSAEQNSSLVKRVKRETTGQDAYCQCLIDLVIDFMVAHKWNSITVVQQKGQSVLEGRCLRGRGPGRGLLQTLWKRGWTVAVHDGGNAAELLRRPEEVGHQNYLVVNNEQSRGFIQEASEKLLLSYTSWLVLSEDKEMATLKQLAMSLDVFIISQFFVLSYEMCAAQVWALYRVGPRVSDVHVENGGRWTSADRFLGDALTSDRVDRRSDFKGYPMKGIGVKVFEFFTNYPADGGVSGYVGDIITTLKHAHNFTLTFRVLEGYGYGKLLKKGTNDWSGMVGELQNRRVDFTVSELSITRERAEVVTYTQPVGIVARKLFVALVKDDKQKILTYFTPMEPTLYACIFTSMTIMAVILMLVDKTVHKYLPGRYESEPTSMGTATWYIISALVQQGCVSCPSGLSPRMVFWIVFILSVLIFTAYTATLVSILAIEKPTTLPFENLFELSKLSGWDAGCNVDDLFQVTASQTCAVEPRTDECQILYDTWNNNVMRSPDNLVNNYIEGLEKALEGEYVFIGVGVTTRYYMGKMPKEQACKLRELPGLYIQGGIAIGMQYHSPFQPTFDRSLQKIRESGLMHKLGKIWLSRAQICDSKNIVSAELIDVSSLFVLLVLGMFLSFMVLAVENVVWSLSSDKNNAGVEDMMESAHPWAENVENTEKIVDNSVEKAS